MRRSELVVASLILAVTGGAVVAEPSVRRLVSAPVGGVIELETPVARYFEAVVAVEGDRALVSRLGEGRWADATALRTWAPVENRFATVLSPRFAEDGRTVVAFESHAVTHLVRVGGDQSLLVGMNGEVYPIGRFNEDWSARLEGVAAGNVPVRSGQTVVEAIEEFHPVDRTSSVAIPVDRTRELDEVDVPKLREQADARVQVKSYGERRAERAAEAAREAGNRARIEHALRRARELK